MFYAFMVLLAIVQLCDSGEGTSQAARFSTYSTNV